MMHRDTFRLPYGTTPASVLANENQTEKPTILEPKKEVGHTPVTAT